MDAVTKVGVRQRCGFSARLLWTRGCVKIELMAMLKLTSLYGYFSATGRSLVSDCWSFRFASEHRTHKKVEWL